jgi:hypothetical protein
MFAWVFYMPAYVEQPSLHVISPRESGAPHGVFTASQSYLPFLVWCIGKAFDTAKVTQHFILLIPTVLCRKLHAIAPCPLRHQHTYWQSNNKSAGSLGTGTERRLSIHFQFIFRSIFFTFLSLSPTFSLLISFTYSIKATGSSYNGFQS